MAAPTGIFNALDNGVSPNNTAGLNTTNLNALVSSLLSPTGPTNGTGGTIEFPMIGSTGSPGTYMFSGTITVGPNPASIIFRGTTAGSGTNPGPPANPTPVPVLQQTVGQDLFVVDNNPGGSADISGILFEDLSIQFSQGLSAGAAVHVTGGSNCVRLHRVTLINCPIGCNFDDSLSCSIVDCQIYQILPTRGRLYPWRFWQQHKRHRNFRRRLHVPKRRRRRAKPRVSSGDLWL